MMKCINEFAAGERIDVELLVTNCTKGVSNAGSPYLNVSFQDKTGLIEGKKWDAQEMDSIILEVGKIVKVVADVIEYRGSKQLKICSVEELDQSSVDFSHICMPSPVPKEELIRKLNGYINGIKNQDCKAIVTKIINDNYDAYTTYPAASRNHHEYMSGLLFHTISMTEMATLIASYYDSIDKDMLITGALLHDVGKVVELSGPVATKYTLEGKLLGHISIAMATVRKTAEELNITSEIPTLLEHMILSHHGSKEFGSPVLPLTREALVLHFVDDLDSKMNILDKALIDTPEGEWTQRIIAMDGRAFYKPKSY